MPVWDKVKHELDRAGRVAQEAFDEGRLRLEAFRARQLADKAAEALGYAVHRARAAGVELESDAYSRLAGTLAEREADAARLETRLQELQRARREHARRRESEPAMSDSTSRPEPREPREPAEPEAGAAPPPPPPPPAPPEPPTPPSPPYGSA